MQWRYGKKHSLAMSGLNRGDQQSPALSGEGKRWATGVSKFRGGRRLVLVLGYTCLVVLLSAFVFLHISQYVEMTEIQFRISKLKRDFTRIERDIQVLQFEFEKMASATTIEAEAVSRLGMVHPSEIMFVLRNEEGKPR
jgi:cell division protein FtsB